MTFFVSADDTMTNKNIFQDSDQDGLSNDEEALYKTDPLDKDSDDDGYTDGVEVESGYDPLKPAPGDKLVDTKEGSRVGESQVGGSVNLTTQVSEQIATMVQESALEGGEEVTLDTITESVQRVLDQTDQEIILPEVNVDEVKVKKVSKKLKETQRKEKEKEDAVEYLTMMAYILANNAPSSVKSKGSITDAISDIGLGSLTAISSGNTSYLDEIAKKGENALEELNDIEVPEDMLDIHVKAIKMIKYSISLKDESKKANIELDPLGQISFFSKVQGFLGVTSSFYQEVYSKLDDYGIQEIQVDF